MRRKNKEGVTLSNQVIIGYKDLFGKSPDVGRLGLLSKVSNNDVIVELAGLNYRLRGAKNRVIDTSFETQLRELDYFCGKNKKLYEKYASLIDVHARGQQRFIFSRQACLFGLEEIIQSDLPVIEGFKMSNSFDSWEALLLYILCVNDEITKIEESKPGEPVNFETLNPKLLPIAELMVISDPFNIVYRGWNLMIYLDALPETALHLNDYFSENYSISYDKFIFELLRMWMAKKRDQDHFNFYFQLSENEQAKRLFEMMSNKYPNTETNKLLNIRKNPFFSLGDNDFLLTDLTNLLDKAYYQFINDFFFDKLKAQERSLGKNFTMQDYKGIIGGFFESYVRDKLSYAFSKARNILVRTFDQLIVNKAGNSAIECGDIYIRHENKVIFGEVKAGSLYDREKYSGNVDAMYKNNRKDFFKNFGVDQLVTNIQNIESNIESVDPEFNKTKKIRIWPIIVFNEKAFQTPFMADIFNKRFRELMGDFKNKHYYVYPLTLLHISDLEVLECELNKRPYRIWPLLTENFSNPKKFIPPFYHTLNANNIRADYKRFRDKVTILFDKFGPDKPDFEPTSS